MIPNRFQGLDLPAVTVENCSQLLPESLFRQVEDFLPPSGSFDDGCLRRYLENVRNYEEEDANSGMTLANPKSTMRLSAGIITTSFFFGFGKSSLY
jgi:hypothetical protein